MRELSINNFKRQLSVTYGGDQYLVRDNGAVCRQARLNKRMRRFDGVWTFGRQCRTHGYRLISSAVVHKIVATAFIGEQPTPNHVVDHLDTNRRNNRVENLRWVTRLENIANNPKTLGRIKQKWGSVEAMLGDPNRAEKVEPLSNRSWMPQIFEEADIKSVDVDSFTPLARQRNWKTPSAFPSCPDKISDQALSDYFSQLQIESIFSHNRYGETLVEMAILSEERSFIAVLTRIIDGVKNFGVTKITFEDYKFVHEACGTFFTMDGATKKQYEMLGKLWIGEDSIDNYC